MWKYFLRFGGPGLLIAVGYMDPGNWATDIAAGSRFGYSLIFIVLLSSCMGMLLQYLSIKLGVATGKDLAQISAQEYNSQVRITLWILAEIGIIACDLAEVLGVAIALNLLFHLPMIIGSLFAIFDTVLVLFFFQSKARYLESFIASLMLLIVICFIYNFIIVPPAWSGVLKGLLPPFHLATNPQALLIAVGILGATVMPHNLYIHGHIVQDKLKGISNVQERKQGLKALIWDSNISLIFAFVINAFILILAASHFYTTTNPIDSITDAYHLLSPLGTNIAGILFAIALLAAGQNATIIGTIAGQVVMSGFLHLNISPAKIRFFTRLTALLPVVICLEIFGDKVIDQLLIFSQVILSLQLPFAAVPLLLFTNNKRLMGSTFANTQFIKTVCWVVVGMIILLNIILIILSI